MFSSQFTAHLNPKSFGWFEYERWNVGGNSSHFLPADTQQPLNNGTSYEMGAGKRGIQSRISYHYLKIILNDILLCIFLWKGVFFCSLKYLMKKRGGENVWKLKKSLHLDKHMFLMWKESELLCPCHHTYYLPISNNSFSLPLPWKLCFRFFVLAPPHRWNQRLCKNINHRDSSFVLSKLSSILGCWVVH